MQNSDFRARITSLYGSQTSPMVFFFQNCAFSTGIASLYGSQPTSVVLCIRKSDFSITITSLEGTQPSFVSCACKTASLGQELQVSMGRRPHLCFYCIQNSDFSNRIASLYVSKTSSVVLRFHIRDIMTRFNSLSMGPSPHLWFCAFAAAILYQN